MAGRIHFDQRNFCKVGGGTDVGNKETKKVNCAKCNKPLKRIKRYYRNAKFYCNKKCFNAAKTQTEKKDA